MNEKEEIIRLLKREIAYFKESDLKTINKLIAATEAAIFDVPSEDEIEKYAMKHSTGCYVDFIAGVNFILNYKKPESDGKL